jgi:hypothetical protein
VAEIVDAAQWHDARRDLSGFPVAVAEVVQVEVAAVGRREEKLRLAEPRCELVEVSPGGDLL